LKISRGILSAQLHCEVTSGAGEEKRDIVGHILMDPESEAEVARYWAEATRGLIEHFKQADKILNRVPRKRKRKEIVFQETDENGVVITRALEVKVSADLAVKGVASAQLPSPATPTEGGRSQSLNQFQEPVAVPQRQVHAPSPRSIGNRGEEGIEDPASY
jgi:hypothetical protein